MQNEPGNDRNREETPRSSRLPLIIGFIVLLAVVLGVMLLIGGSVL